MSTLKEIAKYCGVSAITVSRVINKPELVNEETRIKVQAAMKELQYIPNQAAKALVSNKVGVVDVFIPESIELSNPFAMNFIAGVSDVLSRHHYSFLIRRNMEYAHKCDGFIVMGLDNDEEIEQMKRSGVPIVLFGHSDNNEFDWIDIDNFAGGYMMTEYLIKQGHKDIGMLSVGNSSNSKDRLAGYTKALEDHEIPFRSQWIKYCENTESDGYIKTVELLNGNKISAVFCSTDMLALGAVRGAKMLGYTVPNELSIGGFDGLGYHLLTEPKITTIRQPVYTIGQKLAEALFSIINGKSQEQVNMLIKPDLVIEHSVIPRRIEHS